MSARQLFTGVDVGTSGVKAVLIDSHGEVIAEAEASYPLATPRPGWTEQDPEDWWRRSAEVLGGICGKARELGGEVAGVGLTGQMHSSVFLDAADRVIRPALLWNDTRTAAECREIERRAGGVERLVGLTANLALEGFTAPKLLWLRNHEPEHYARLEHLLLAKDYLRFRLTGERATEVSDASGTLLFDVAARDWSREMLEALELDPSLLPRCHESPEVSGRLTAEAAAATGLAEGTPVVGGGGDQAAGAVGNGVVRPGQLCLALGTSGVAFAPLAEHKPEPEGRLHTFCHAVPGRWHAMGVMLSAAGAFQWFHDRLGAGADFQTLDREAAEIPAGAGGVMFLPYLVGERTPHNDPHARGVLTGLSLGTDRGALARAVLEGVAYGLRDCLELIRASGATNEDRALISGGGARSDLWCQIVADVLGIAVARLHETPGPAYGAALLAAVGLGRFADVDAACAGRDRVEREFEPRADQRELYEQGYARFRGLYSRLVDFFPEAVER